MCFCIGLVGCGKVFMFPVLDLLYVERVKCFLYWTCCMSESGYVSCIGLVICGKGLNVFSVLDLLYVGKGLCFLYWTC